MTMPPGTMFGDYRIVRRLGQGGMGAVYLVENPQLGRYEALKVIAPTADADFQTRFTQEARTAAALDHPGIIGVHHVGIADGVPWFTMTYLDGADLTHAGLSAAESLGAVTRVAAALDYAHGRGVVHRDVKPANIVVTRTAGGMLDKVVVLDFGIAKLADTAGVTATGAFIGTLAYTAPEMLEGRPPSPRSDQYALACTAFELLTGTPPFDGPTPVSIMSAHASAPVPAISARRPDLASLDPVFVRALAKNPAERFASCTEFTDALRTAIARPAPPPPPTLVRPVVVPTPPRRRTPPAAIAAVAVVAAILVIGVVVAVVKTVGGSSDEPVTTAAPPPTSTATITSSTVPTISACVYNAGVVTGASARAARSLTGAGIDVLETSNLQSRSVTENVVFYPAGRESEARTVAAAVPGGAVAEPRPAAFTKCPGEIAVIVVD
ncbi:hypothetical protein nbrc107696_39590 [Gordonia spumicola]|uniref:non-specific serine/threonine protein kinase n=1 Tax=Gordonia spumicola TaxID=589161 RepID=A0A7I9VEH2_9ACTN|nr:serine/threonine-protein kinase [Gordonia spumicola]GEE03513.1 hypothetical protein nbrc107696_39590 [Gordonia spumicola]